VPSLELFVPELVPALPASADFQRALPALHRWLSRARVARSPCDSVEQALCERFGVARQRDWPVAPLTLAADGGEPGEAYWLRADPAHLQAGRTDLVLARTRALALSAAEAQALTASLNHHFGAEGLRFVAPVAQRWYLRMDAPPALATTPAHAAIGRSIDALLPRGEDALRWHRRLNEVQMLLHEHPVNAAREARGAEPVNSVWLWGGGRMPACRMSAALDVWSDSALAGALARCAGIPRHALPASGEAWLGTAGDGRHLVAFDEESTPAPAGAEARLDRLERGWFAPLLAALRSGVLSEIVLITQQSAQRLCFAASRSDLWRFWRRAIPFAASPTSGPDAA
jgi:hypothetical protein